MFAETAVIAQHVSIFQSFASYIDVSPSVSVLLARLEGIVTTSIIW